MHLQKNLFKAVCCDFQYGVKCKLWHWAFTFCAKNTAWAVASRSNWSKEVKVSMLFGLESTSCGLMVGTLHWSCWHLQGGWSCFRLFRIISCECWSFCIWSSCKILATRSKTGIVSQSLITLFSVQIFLIRSTIASINACMFFKFPIPCDAKLNYTFCLLWDFGGLNFMANVFMCETIRSNIDVLRKHHN